MSESTDGAFRVRRKRAILSAWAGFAIDSYSIFIASTVLLPALVYFQGDMSTEAKSIFAGMTRRNSRTFSTAPGGRSCAKPPGRM